MHPTTTTRIAGAALALLASASTASASTCTFSSSIDLGEIIDLDSSSGSGSGSSGPVEGLTPIVCADGRIEYFQAACLDVDFRRRSVPQLHSRQGLSLECSSAEMCVSYGTDVLGCLNEDMTLRDGGGTSLNLITGDYELADGTTGNLKDGVPDEVDTGSATGTGSGSGSSSGDSTTGSNSGSDSSTDSSSDSSSDSSTGSSSGSTNGEDDDSAAGSLRAGFGFVAAAAAMVAVAF